MPSKLPSALPSAVPSNLPSDDPFGGQSGYDNEDCRCDKGDASKQTFKCGNVVYVCPGMDKVCSTTGSRNSLYYPITQYQCNTMKLVEIGEKCVALHQFGIDNPKGLSNRVCYTDQGS